MTTKNEKKHSLGIIAIYILLMASFVWVQLNVFGVFDKEVAEEDKRVKSDQEHKEVDKKWKPLKAAQGMFLVLKNQHKTPNFVNSSAKERTLEKFYRLRAYLGAPPVIPHPVKGKKNDVAGTCNHCHKKGGYVAKYNAFTPVTPHPELGNCTQCHAAKRQNSTFRQTNWQNRKKVRLRQSALIGAPPVIPHGVAMRENCHSCHAGPAAVKEIRVTHPERVNCLQCHVVNNQKTISQMPVKNIWMRRNEKK